MTIEIVDILPHPKGMLYTLRISEEIIRILFLFHAIGRIKKWGIIDKMVVETLLLPEEVMTGHRDRYIAHRRYGNHLVRDVYGFEQELPVLITVYFPFVGRYFKGGGFYENKIFKGS